MTIDITIGKLKIKKMEEVIQYEIRENKTIGYGQKMDFTDFIEIEQAPDTEDGCTEKDTIYPNSAYRSGPISGMESFFRIVMPNLIMKIRPISTNDPQFSLIKPFIQEINELQYKGREEIHKKRLQWLKFWCNLAVQLYGDNAAILFN